MNDAGSQPREGVAVRWSTPGSVTLANWPRVDPSETEVVVEQTRVGICGSDVTIVAGHHARARTGVVLGHEFSGTVCNAPAAPELLGRRVAVRPTTSCSDRGQPPCEACRRGAFNVCLRLKLLGVDSPGGLATSVRVPLPCIYPLDDTVPEAIDVLAEPLAVAVRAVRRATPKTADSVAVFGGGPIGTLIALVLVHSGVDRMCVIEPSPKRRAMLGGIGIDSIAPGRNAQERIQSMTNGDGADIAFDCAGQGAVVQAMFASTRTGATLIIVGVHAERVDVDLRALNFRELVMKGSRVYGPADFEEAARLLAGDTLGLARLPLTVFPVHEAQKAFDAAASASVPFKAILELDPEDE